MKQLFVYYETRGRACVLGLLLFIIWAIAGLESLLRRNPSGFSRIMASALDSGNSLYPRKR